MYPHPELHSYLQGYNPHVPKKILNHAIEKATYAKTSSQGYKSEVIRLASTQPQCFAPHVDVTRAKCAFGPYALPKLRRELHSKDPLIVRQATTTLADLVINPEKLLEAVNLNIPDRLTDLLSSNDPYLRERAAMIYATIANQAAGREAILKNLSTIANFSSGLDDSLAVVRLKIAQAVKNLVREYYAAEQLCICGFVEIITDKICTEKKDILLVELDILRCFLHRNVKEKAIECGTFDNLMSLLHRKDQRILCKTLMCLGILCEDSSGKSKAIEVDLLSYLKCFLKDEREQVNTEACRVVAFITITTPGKLRFLELRMTKLLFCLASQNKCRKSLLLTIMKTLTNIAEAPEGRRLLLEKHVMFIEDIEVGDSDVMQRHKQTLLDVIRWRP